MSAQLGISRNALIWLLVAQVLVIAPHLLHLPLWVSGLWLVVVVWRVQIFRMRLNYPNAWIKGALMLAVLGAIVASRGVRFGVDSVAVLLICTFILKVLEMRTQRDALVVVFLGLFCVCTSYLFDAGMLASLYSALPLTVLLAAMIGLQQRSLSARPWRSLRLAATLLVQAAPLMVVLFLLFPRVGPLWSLPVPSDKGVTGLSDNMAPADIAELSRSPALAFRASFTGAVPLRDQQYWRALTLDHFDGRRWSQSSFTGSMRAPSWQPEGEVVDYSVVLEPTNKPWLMALDVAQLDEPRARMMSDFRWQRNRPVDRPLLYSVRSWPQAAREITLPEQARRSALQLPEQGDPLSREWGRQLRREHDSEQAVVEAIMQRFNQQPYHYTLRPPSLGTNSVDDFLFNTMAGFCAHYAGAMTVVLRAAGIPARVVTGYQGGEFNEAGNYLQVRQFDAHAWVEYWQPERGWTRVDPTFAVAPERIELGLEQALGEDEEFLQDQILSPLRYRNTPWINSMRLRWESLNYDWQRLVLGYQGEQQGQLLKRLFGSLDWTRIGLSAVSAIAVFILLCALWVLKPWRHRPASQQRALLRFERLMARQQVQRKPGEGLRVFAQRAAAQLPESATLIQCFAKAYEQLHYAGDAGAEAQVKQALKALKKALPWRMRGRR